MEKWKKAEGNKRFPLRFWWVLAIVVGFNCLVYYLCRAVNLGRAYHCISLSIDSVIPFIPGWILVYVLAYLQWALGYYQIGQMERSDCHYYVSALLIAKALCGLCFLLYPTCMEARPVPTGSDFLSRLAARIFAADTPPDNLFPSIHCLESWMCLRITLRSPRLPGWVKGVCAVFTVLVFASVVLVKQHVFIDIPAGIAVGELGLLLSWLIFRERKHRT